MEMHVPSGLQQHLPLAVLKRAPLTVLYLKILALQQYLLLTVCAAGCETAEEQSDDEARTSQVPERSEGKTKVISNSTYRLRYEPKGARQQRSKATMRSALLLPKQSEGKTKVMKQQYLPFTVLKRVALWRYIQRVFCCNSTYRLQY